MNTLTPLPEEQLHDGWAIERHNDLAQLHERLASEGWRIAVTDTGWQAMPPITRKGLPR